MTRLAILSPLLIMLLHASAISHPGASSAIDHYTHEIEHQPDEQSLYIRRGIAYSSDGQYDKALTDFKQAEKLGAPIVVGFDLGVLYYRRGEFDMAKAYFDTYLDTFPDHAACLEYRARLLRDMGDTKGSVADFQRVFELQQRPNPGHYVSVAGMLEASGPKGIARALAILDGGNAKLGITPQLQQCAIRLELLRGRADLAIKRLETLRPILGDSPEWKVEMAELQLQTGEQEAATQLLKEAMDQLDSLRKTPARQALRERIAMIEKRR
jgi:tetratricopeptide (TPR) repeat protein